MTIRNTFYISLFLFIIFCDNLQAIEIRGTVLDDRYFPVPRVTVIATGNVITETDNQGKFSLFVEKTPYNLIILDGSSSVGSLYTNLTIQNPEIFLFGLSSSRYVHTEMVKVNFPEIPNGRNAIIKFISDNIFYCPDVTANSGENSKVLTITFPSYIKALNGKIIYLERTQYSYKKFSEKALTVIPEYYPQSVALDTVSFLSNLGESYVTVYPPAFAYDSKGFSVYADFLSQHRNAELTLNTTEGDITSAKILIPKNLPYGYRLKIEGRGNFKTGEGFVNYNYSYPGASLNIQTETPLKLESPQDKYWYVNRNTNFSWEWGSGTGIYVLHIRSISPVGDFYIVTVDKNFRNVLGYSGDILAGNEYSWEVKKYLTYLNVDDFARPRRFANDLGYKAILTSDMRTFRLNPF